MSKFLIAGLGNIGAEYAHTRHNIGFDILDAFAESHEGVFQTDRLADVARIRFRGKTLVCIKPATYVNLSGKSVRYWLDKEHIPVEQLLVIVDEIALPLDRLQLKAKGSDGGHNGLKSIQESIGTTDYARLRFGIGNDYPRGMQAEFVLGRWGNAELPVVRSKIGKSIEVIENYVVMGVERAMNQVNNLRFGT
jgi:PTH1 family peptidyl-tRNA hydrolase